MRINAPMGHVALVLWSIRRVSWVGLGWVAVVGEENAETKQLHLEGVRLSWPLDLVSGCLL